MSQYISTHNAEGKAIFSTKVPTETYKIPMQGDEELGSNQILYSTDDAIPNLSTETDIDEYSKLRTEGHPPGTIGPANGVAVGIVTLRAAQSPWHRTMTLDTIYILEGEVELHLDGGEMRHMKAGDSIVQRGTMHMWRNVTPGGGAARLIGVAQGIQQPLEVGGQKLTTEWKM